MWSPSIWVSNQAVHINNNNIPTGFHNQPHKGPSSPNKQTPINYKPLPLERERERASYWAGLERGIKGEDNKHLILSLHSFRSSVCQVNKPGSIQSISMWSIDLFVPMACKSLGQDGCQHNNNDSLIKYFQSVVR